MLFRSGSRTLLASLINAPLGFTISSQSSASASITDNDVAVVVPVISIGSATQALPEGNSGTTLLPLTVSLSASTTVPVTVNWSLVNGTATFGAAATTPGADYSAAAQSGTLTFAPGQTSQSVSVSILGDTTVEADETFQFVVNNATNATFKIGRAHV